MRFKLADRNAKFSIVEAATTENGQFLCVTLLTGNGCCVDLTCLVLQGNGFVVMVVFVFCLWEKWKE